MLVAGSRMSAAGTGGREDGAGRGGGSVAPLGKPEASRAATVRAAARA